MPGCTVGAASSAAAFPTAGSTGSAVTVHLDVVHQGTATLVIAPVRVNGKGPYPFILDTGASTSAINSSLASQLGLQPTGQSAQVSGVTSSQQV